ncbi:MAG: carbohydrate kinase family protein [Bacteroidales bacterium]|nr:carbohydrate kinase family protein [Bacteroidales bacterium]
MRKGIVSAGNWLVDSVKMIEKYPSPGNLITIESIEVGAGGCSHNVLVDLAKMKADIPLYAGGCIGNDANGKYIIEQIKSNNIDGQFMTVIPGELTSYTDVMAEKGGKSRTYFHYRGANAWLDIKHLENIDTNAKIFHLGYLLLLDKLDSYDNEYKVRAARALKMLQEKGYKTSVDVVSEESDRFAKIIVPCLPYINYLIINEIEAAQCCGIRIREDDDSYSLDNLKRAAKFLLDNGVNEQVTIHFPEGGYTITKAGKEAFIESYKLPSKDIVSTVGAGDAFCAGMLYSIHENYSIEKALQFASASARFNLLNATCTGGAPDINHINSFIQHI